MDVRIHHEAVPWSCRLFDSDNHVRFSRFYGVDWVIDSLRHESAHHLLETDFSREISYAYDKIPSYSWDYPLTYPDDYERFFAVGVKC